MRDAHRRQQHEDERLSAFLDDELPEREALEVTRHLAACDRCMAELEDVRAARSALRRLPNVDPPAALFLDAELFAAADAAVRWPLGMRVLVAALAGSAVLGGAAFAAGGSPDGTVVPPVELFVVDHVVRVGGGPVITSVDLGSSRR